MQINFVKGTITTKLNVTAEGTDFFVKSANIIVTDKETRNEFRLFKVNYIGKKPLDLKIGDRVVFVGEIIGDQNGRPYIRETSEGAVWTAFDIETARIYKDTEDFCFSYLLGNLGKEPDNRFTPGGDFVSSFSFATNKSHKAGTEWITKTIWWRLTAWRELGERISNEAKKGMKLFIAGALNYDPETGGPRLWDRTMDNGEKVPSASYEMTLYNYRKLEKGQNKDEQTPTEQQFGDEEIPF
jgi:single-strand DNA-binding protein